MATQMTSYLDAYSNLTADLMNELSGHSSTRRGAMKMARIRMYLLGRHWAEVSA